MAYLEQVVTTLPLLSICNECYMVLRKKSLQAPSPDSSCNSPFLLLLLAEKSHMDFVLNVA